MVLQKIREEMSSEAIIGMIICLSITLGGFLVFLKIALSADKKDKNHPEPLLDKEGSDSIEN